MKYHEAYNKIIDAYFKDEIKPYRTTFCFCGTLSGNSSWAHQAYGDFYPYSVEEFGNMEKALLTPLGCKMHTVGGIGSGGLKRGHPQYENSLFKGMCDALEVLRKIHVDRGEIIEQTTFKKRELMGTPGRD